MMEYVIFIVLIIGSILYALIKKDFLKIQENKLVKEDQILTNESIKLKQEIKDLKKELDKPSEKMNESQILDFWNKGGKK